jgi:hypothetical protein
MPLSSCKLHNDESRSEVSTPSLATRRLLHFAGIIFVLLIYCYPSLRARSELQATTLPPMFSADLSLYLNLSDSPATTSSQFLNPYYLVRVPYNGSGYLQFNVAPTLFAKLRTVLGGRLWLSVFLWNVLWWSFLSTVTVWLLERFLPAASSALLLLGLMLMMVFNFGILKTVLTAWAHLPAMARFESVGLPYMRSFVPVIPIALLVAYLGLQMEVLRRRKTALIWVAMGTLQFVALASFPYATLMMAGITAVSATWQVTSSGKRRAGLVIAAYGLLCAVADATFVRRGTLGFYSTHTSLIQLQPAILPHLIGGNWLILFIITSGIVFSKRLSPEVKWPLVGLGATNLILMLGDAVVPATTILLSIHAGYFIQPSIAILLIFLVSTALPRLQGEFPHPSFRAPTLFAGAIALVAVNGLLVSLGTYRGYLAYNREEADLARTLSGPTRPARGDLVIARSHRVDDLCAWIFLLTRNQVLFCTDAEVMLTPQQNLDIHRFRQAIYLYLTGRDGESLRRMLADRNRLNLMYELGYWAEAASLSPPEQEGGVRAIEHDLIPLVERVEQRDVAVSNFFRQFPKIVVVDDPENPTFSQERLATYLKFEYGQLDGHLQLRTYTARR